MHQQKYHPDLNLIKMNQQQNNNTLMSIYIPRMSASTTESEVRDRLHASKIGEVRRVDFTPIKKKPGFGENVDSIVKSAFVHFHRYYNDRADFLENIQIGENKCVLYLDAEKRSYWMLLKATNVVPDTMMNNHQIVENCRLLEKKVVEQEERIQKLEKLVNCLLGGKNYSGYDNEDQDTYLQMMKFKNNIQIGINKYSMEEDNSTHSSMPSLIGMQDASSDSEERVKNSYELCGNE
jgi:hypothetical protein